MVSRFWANFRLSGASEIARRYFVMNAFDGILTLMGLVVGAQIVRVADIGPVVRAGLGAILAMGLSGSAGAFITERAERQRKLKELEAALLVPLDGTRHGEAARTAVVVAALVDGVSPAIGGLAVLLPLFLLPPGVAVVASVTVSLALMGLLGAYLARVARGGLLVYTASMVGVGLLTAGLLMAMERFLP